MQCKRCKGENYYKSGKVRGLQRYRCKDCGCNFTDTQDRQHSVEKKRQAVFLYLEGLGFRSIARFLNVHNTVVLYWIKQLGSALAPKTPAEIEIMELDEMWHYIQKKGKNYGSGWLLTELESVPSQSKPVVVVKRQD